MDFDYHDDDAEEEMGLSNYEPAVLANSEREKQTRNDAVTARVVDLGVGPSSRKAASGVRYRECQKNHAVSIGGHAVDGCCEFLPAGEEGSLDALRCAACSCHRNFHRKEVEGGVGDPTSAAAAAGGGVFHSPFSTYYSTPAGYLHHHHHQYQYVTAAQQRHHRRPVPLALPSTSGGGHSREEMDDVSNPMCLAGYSAGAAGPSSSSGKKRFRTKFSQEQKDKMLAFAEAIGWRIQKQDEDAVQQFCNEISVKRHVLKVWMHNNKHTLGKKT